MLYYAWRKSHCLKLDGIILKEKMRKTHYQIEPKMYKISKLQALSINIFDSQK